MKGVDFGTLYNEYKNTAFDARAVSYTHLRAHETVLDLVCRLLLEKNKTNDNVLVIVCLLVLEKTIDMTTTSVHGS